MKTAFKKRRGAHKNLRAFTRNESRRADEYLRHQQRDNRWNAMTTGERRAQLMRGGAKEVARAEAGKLGARKVLKFTPREYRNGNPIAA